MKYFSKISLHILYDILNLNITIEIIVNVIISNNNNILNITRVYYKMNQIRAHYLRSSDRKKSIYNYC